MKAFGDRRFAWAALGLALLKLWLVAAQPVFAIGTAMYDDRLFLLLAEHLLNGKWLGPYSEFTLAKGPMYSLWTAAVFLIGLPLPLANHLLYLLASWLVVRALRPLLASDWVALLLFALLWWNPMTYEAPVLGRILRQNVYTPAALLLFASLIALETRRGASARVRIGWGLLGGASFAALWLTREESIWVVPSLLLLLAAVAWNAWRSPTRLKPLAAPVVAGLAVTTAALVTVCTLNLRHYGWFGTVEFRAPAFIAAYGALQRIDSRSRVPRVPVTREAREKAYRVSPAFAELRPHLEGEIGRNWAGVSSAFTGRPAEDREIAGGWFMWALRGATAAAGHHRSAADALAFYERIAEEVNQACDNGQLAAGPRRDSLMPRWEARDVRRFLATLPDFLDYFARFRGFSAYTPHSHGTVDDLVLFWDLTRWPSSPSDGAPSYRRPLQERFDAARVNVLQGVGKTLRWIYAPVVAGGVLAWLILFVRGLAVRRWSYLWFVSTALLGASLAVVLINALVHVLSFPNQSPGAFAQAYPLAILFGGLAWYELLHSFAERRRAAPVPTDS